MEQELLLRKALSTADISAPASQMNPAQADHFIDMTINESVLLGEGLARTVRVNNRSGLVSRFLFNEPVTKGAQEGVDTSNLVKPTYTSFPYTTTKLRSDMDFTTELFETNLEGAAHKDNVMAALATRMAADFELLAIRGDSAKYAADGSATGLLLRNLNGWYHQAAAGAHLVNLGGASISKVVFSKMLRAMPNVYRQRRNLLRFFCSPSVVQDYRDQLASRNTELGDAALQGATALTVYGVPIIEVPMIPEDLVSYDGSEAWNNGTWAWLTFPQNFLHLISRDIEIYWEFKPRKDAWETTIYTYVGELVENLDALVMATDLRVAGAS